MPRHWLMKSEPGAYSIHDLARDKTTPWEGVRNYQARNLMRDELKRGDRVLFYHSSASPPGVAGLAEVVRESYPDSFAQEPQSPYFDPRATVEKPIWMMVDVGFVAAFDTVIPLATLKADPALADMMVTRKGTRLSVQPVTPEHFAHILSLAGLPDIS